MRAVSVYRAPNCTLCQGVPFQDKLTRSSTIGGRVENPAPGRKGTCFAPRKGVLGHTWKRFDQRSQMAPPRNVGILSDLSVQVLGAIAGGKARPLLWRAGPFRESKRVSSLGIESRATGVTTKSVMHVPVSVGRVLAKTLSDVDQS